MDTRLYLRASTNDQDANRAEAALTAFASEHKLRIVARYRENESGTKLNRPELFRLLADANPGDVLLIEQVDRLSRLNESDWIKLRSMIESRQVRIVALDMPTSWMMTQSGDEFQSRMFAAINSMMLDMLAAMARKDYADRRRRQAQGIDKAKATGRYTGRREDTKRNERIAKLLAAGWSYSQIQTEIGASRATIAKVAKRLLEQ